MLARLIPGESDSGVAEVPCLDEDAGEAQRDLVKGIAIPATAGERHQLTRLLEEIESRSLSLGVN